MIQLKKYTSIGISGIKQHYLKQFSKNLDLQTAAKNAIPILENSPWCLNNTQHNILNFYQKDTIIPYTPASAQGPWIVTQNAAVLYDVGGYGMLGFGHSPKWALEVLAKPHVMANIMTPNLMQKRFTENIMFKIGINRLEGCPYSNFAFLNSGSEAMELATRITDYCSKNEKKPSAFIVLKGSFHGRTTKAAQISDSTKNTYQKYLKSFDQSLPVHTVEINNENQLKETFMAVKNNSHIEAVIMEPVMGEGNPGIPVSKSFYQLARELTYQHNSHLIIDSVQAGIRTTGYLSIVDYPNFQSLPPPDMEIFSKAISSGQYPLSVLAMNSKLAEKFQKGIYGNTMTGNPKALEIGYETLRRITPDVTRNIMEKGKKFKKMLQNIQSKYPEIASHVTGTGLLIALHIDEKYPVVGKKGLEYLCRNNGLNVIHGGKNALRFTPHFLITDEEIELVENILIDTFSEKVLQKYDK
jgi:acetylornithine/succinyldiaminopimelate/putrescine aminotransferase